MDITRFCKNMKQRPMKTVSEHCYLNPTKRRASEAVTVLLLIKSIVL